MLMGRGWPIEGVVLADEDSMLNEAAFVIGVLIRAPRREAADRYLAFLRTTTAQDAYARHGFDRATADELTRREIKSGKLNGPSRTTINSTIVNLVTQSFIRLQWNSHEVSFVVGWAMMRSFSSLTRPCPRRLDASRPIMSTSSKFIDLT